MKKIAATAFQPSFIKQRPSKTGKIQSFSCLISSAQNSI
ncbi:hypothetical protein D1BOALGB6SA_3669 [Olavius sp. associated proteobacterium Delta 1]|nr:hypothetical protein D1BOALGB6SA_3669 [Olavius sp. associated proteobacterium Delta 1]